jgi:cell wall-associated NlpC family hydrolase
MVKHLLPALSFLFVLSSCSTFKPLNFTSNKQVGTQAAPTSSKTKFIDDITVTPQVTEDKTTLRPGPQVAVSTSRGLDVNEAPAKKQDAIEEILAVRNSRMDEWYGVRYRTGGNTKSGVDCSGFTVAVYAAMYGFALPRVSREQYRTSRKISTTELEEGDLVFFNTNGRGVSHVGVYLGNNKFIHASVSRGVMVNDLFEPYYLKRYIGAGRFDDKQMVSSASN